MNIILLINWGLSTQFNGFHMIIIEYLMHLIRLKQYVSTNFLATESGNQNEDNIIGGLRPSLFPTIN